MTGPFSNETAPRPLDRMLDDPALRAAAGYWDGLRAGMLVPPRMALDPAGMRPLLQRAAILERARPGTVRIRLGGARISEMMGMEVRGLPFRALFDLADRGSVTAEIERALADPSVLVIDAASPAPRYQPQARLRTRLLILPMSDRAHTINRALYVMGDVEGDACPGTETPCRWSVERIARVALHVGVPVATPEDVTPPAAPPEVPHWVEEDDLERRGPMARARFRVIQGGLA
jgi:hypothetical protein